MKPDGALTIVLHQPWADHPVRKEQLLFSQIKCWQGTDTGLRIMYDDRRVMVPWNHIIKIEVQYNSGEYVKWARENEFQLREQGTSAHEISVRTGERFA